MILILLYTLHLFDLIIIKTRFLDKVLYIFLHLNNILFPSIASHLPRGHGFIKKNHNNNKQKKNKNTKKKNQKQKAKNKETKKI